MPCYCTSCTLDKNNFLLTFDEHDDINILKMYIPVITWKPYLCVVVVSLKGGYISRYFLRRLYHILFDRVFYLVDFSSITKHFCGSWNYICSLPTKFRVSLNLDSIDRLVNVIDLCLSLLSTNFTQCIYRYCKQKLKRRHHPFNICAYLISHHVMTYHPK